MVVLDGNLNDHYDFFILKILQNEEEWLLPLCAQLPEKTTCLHKFIQLKCAQKIKNWNSFLFKCWCYCTRDVYILLYSIYFY